MTCPQPFIRKNFQEALEKREEVIRSMNAWHKKSIHIPESITLSLHTNFAYYYTKDASNPQNITNTASAGLDRLLHHLPAGVKMHIDNTSRISDGVAEAFSKISKAEMHQHMRAQTVETAYGHYDNKECLYRFLTLVTYYNFPSTDYDTEHDLTLLGYWIYLFRGKRPLDSVVQDGKPGEAEIDSTYMIDVDGSHEIPLNL